MGQGASRRIAGPGRLLLPLFFFPVRWPHPFASCPGSRQLKHRPAFLSNARRGMLFVFSTSRQADALCEPFAIEAWLATSRLSQTGKLPLRVVDLVLLLSDAFPGYQLRPILKMLRWDSAINPACSRIKRWNAAKSDCNFSLTHSFTHSRMGIELSPSGTIPQSGVVLRTCCVHLFGAHQVSRTDSDLSLALSIFCPLGYRGCCFFTVQTILIIFPECIDSTVDLFGSNELGFDPT
ncbi:hypothetical protein T06_9717 [Trichinella sp. T6]|nr:hypothetical protein T06_9717 [Trichinella sp. T6]